MTRNNLRVDERFRFSLTGIPGVSSYASMPVIANDRIRKVPDTDSERSRKAQSRDAETPVPADSTQGENASK